jgi:hypothetical protein
MGVKPEELQEIGAVLSAAGAEASAYGQLRARFPHLAWTRCDASDVAETPLQTNGLFDVHLIDGSDHCVQVTSDLARATGVILARRSAVL